MGNFRDNIRASEEYQTLDADKGQGGGGSGSTTTTATPQAQGLGPVTSMEKGDLMFWMAVVQTALLFLIWRELIRGAA